MKLGLCLSAVLAATPAMANPEGCYRRDYLPDHIAAHPEQVVSMMSIHFGEYQGTPDASLTVWLTEQGHVRGTPAAGTLQEQWLICEPGACFVECDGGSFEIRRDDGDVIDIRTDYLMVGDMDGCGGLVDLAERPGQPVTYRLYKSDDPACETN